MPRHVNGKVRFGTRSSIFARFIRKVEVEPGSECWIWTGAVCRQGGVGRAWQEHRAYGHMDGVPITKSGYAKAHRVSCWLFRPGFDPKLQVDHLCENTLCVNPYHLELVDGEENNRRRFERVPEPDPAEEREWIF